MDNGCVKIPVNVQIVTRNWKKGDVKWMENDEDTVGNEVDSQYFNFPVFDIYILDEFPYV